MEIDLTGLSLDYEDRDLFPTGIPIATDGAGNFWVLDDDGTVFFASHDPPFAIFVDADVEAFVEAAGRGEVAPPEPKPVPALSHEDALAGDAELSAFAAELDERFVVFDLRNPAPGDGFEWGRFGPRTEVRRFGTVLLFACAPPAEKPRRGLFRRR